MIKYGLYTGLPPTLNIGDDKSPFLAVRIIDIILDDKHPEWEKYGGWDSLGLIKFIPFYSSLEDNTQSINIAKPLFANIKNYPLLQELTYVITLPDPVSADNPNFSSYYYINSINIWNHPHHNALPSLDNNQSSLSYNEINSGLNNQVLSSSKGITLGKTFVEQSNIRPLLPFEGDVIFEGRFGQSLRFGSTVKDKNLWSSVGDNGNPITIIKNGQASTKDKKGWVPTLEDINNDDTSIYMCSGQAIPIELASTNFDSFKLLIQSTVIPNIQISDNPSPITSSLPIISGSTISTGSQIYSEEDIIYQFPGEELPVFISDDDEESKSLSSTKEIYNKDTIMNESTQTKDINGNYLLYQNGIVIGSSPVVFVGGIRVASKYEPYLRILINAAVKDGINLQLNSSLRTFDEQLALRKQNVKDKTKVNDHTFLLDALSTEFNPFTGRPGFSNHQNGRAFDFNVVVPSIYKWMVINAIKYNFVRTVLTETWHWEYLPNTNQFAYVPKNHVTWENLV